MKKINKLLFVIPFALSLFACVKKTQTEGTTTTETKTTENTTTLSQHVDVYYDIEFVDYDNTVLYQTRVKKGDTPVYSMSNPTRSNDKIYSYTFNGWDKEITSASSNTTYKATYTTIPYVRNDNKIYFGTYPQTLVRDTSKITELNSDTSNWTDYNYYISRDIKSFMFYKDIDTDNDGDYDYRGVYFTQYRPARYLDSSSTGTSFQDDNGYSTNTIYWFSYDPIEWDILTESSGKALIIANLILDSQDFYPSNSTTTFLHNGKSGYANNYELSNIRKFLNETFYNTAFNDLQKSIIEITEVDNSSSTTSSVYSNSYACNKTSDKMFLLSWREAESTYYSSSTARRTKGTDYAKAQGLYVYTTGYSYWWLRSPDPNEALNANYVYSNINDIGRSTVNNGDNGVRPVCWISL